MASARKNIVLLADSQLLFWQGANGDFLQGIVDEHGEQLKAVYIGAANGDKPEYFDLFCAAMERVGIKACFHLRTEKLKDAAKKLQSADVILIAGGSVRLAWVTLEKIQDSIITAYERGASLMGISAGAICLGQVGWSDQHPRLYSDIYDTFGLVPYVVSAHEESNHWRLLKSVMHLTDASDSGLGLPSGGGMLYSPEGEIIPVRHPMLLLEKKQNHFYEKTLSAQVL